MHVCEGLAVSYVDVATYARMWVMWVPDDGRLMHVCKSLAESSVADLGVLWNLREQGPV